jgi:hypothetical protein
MTPAKSGRPGAGAGEVFVEITEKKKLPGFGFSQRDEIGVWPSQETDPGEKVPKNCNSEIRSWRPMISSMETASQDGNPGSDINI